MVLKEEQKQHVISKIKGSKAFKNAPTSRAMLQYLFESTLKGSDVKEGVIEMEFFGNKGGSDKSNPRVRVNIYNLRKKLKKYYQEEGQDDKWQLRIDKGQYKVRFEEQQKGSQEFRKISWSKTLPFVALTFCVIALVITNLPKTIRAVWAPFLTDKQGTNLIIGDHFGATGKTITQGNGWTRDFDINSLNDFYDLLEEKPELKGVLTPANYTYTTRMAALSVQDFQRLFQEHDKNLNIRFSTQTTTSEITEANAIYAGPTKNKNPLIHFFNEGNPYYHIANDSLILSGHPQLSKTVINLKDSKVTEEYAIVSKYPSVSNTTHFVFFSQHDIGVSATVEFFSNSDNLRVFSDTYLKDHDYFTAVFKVKGQNRTNTDIKLESVVTF